MKYSLCAIGCLFRFWKIRKKMGLLITFFADSAAKLQKLRNHSSTAATPATIGRKGGRHLTDASTTAFAASAPRCARAGWPECALTCSRAARENLVQTLATLWRR